MTRIKQARLALGITGKEAAQRIGISRQRYSQYETGACEANYEMLLRISEVLGVSVDWLLNRESTPAELRRSAVVGKIMTMSDAQISSMYALLERLADLAPPPPASQPVSRDDGLTADDLARAAACGDTSGPLPEPEQGREK